MKKKKTETYLQSIRFTKEEKRRILSLHPDLSSYVRDAAMLRVHMDEEMIRYNAEDAKNV